MALGVCSRPAGSTSLRGCLKSLHGFLQRYPHAMVIVDFRELRTIVTSSEAALHQLKTLMSGLFKQPLREAGGARPPAARPPRPLCGVFGAAQQAARGDYPNAALAGWGGGGGAAWPSVLELGQAPG